MQVQPFCSFSLAGVNLTAYGMKIPSPFAELQLTNSEIQSMTSWTLKLIIGGSDSMRAHASAFEALLYSAAQNARGYTNASGIPVSFMFGWLDKNGGIAEHLSYQGFTIKFSVQTSGQFMYYTLTGYASLAVQSSMPVIRIPEMSGVVQPSAVLCAVAEATKATSYYTLDVDRNDAPTLISHGALTTSFNNYVRGNYTGQDNYDQFPGLLKLSKSYNASRDSAGVKWPYTKLSQVLNNTDVSPISSFLKKGIGDDTVQCSSFSYWVDEPTATQPGVIHYKSNAGLLTNHSNDTLEYGTANTNILSINGNYNGVAYSMTDMNFSQVGFNIDGSGNSIVTGLQVVNSWSANLADTFQAVNIINDVNALASQFSGDFTLVIPGNTAKYTLAQPISLLVMSGNTLSPITGIYNIVSISHTVSNEFTTTLKVQRLVMSSANQVAASQNIFVNGSSNYTQGKIVTTSNILSPYKVDFGTIYPTFEDLCTI